VAKRKPPVGSSWRVLAHDARDVAEPFDVHSREYDRRNDGVAAHRNGASYNSRHESRTRQEVFDELVIDGWLHLEQMTARSWWLRIGKEAVFITIDRDGNPKMGEWHE
jgi:hypothetical protein